MPFMHNDQFKRYPLRFAGYGFGVAEAISGTCTYPVIHGLRALTTAFIFAHTLYTPVEIGKRTNSSRKMAIGAGDTFLYESLASGTLPPACAWQIRRLAGNIPVSSGPARMWLPAGIALASLPLVVPVCDEIVDVVMDATIRQLY